MYGVGDWTHCGNYIAPAPYIERILLTVARL
jgi:hypothetical protein